MQTTIQDILTLSTITENVDLTLILPSNSVKRGMADLEINILQSHAVINLQALPNLLGNKVYLTQLFMNLISNVLKFSEKQPVIDIYGAKEDTSVSIYVKRIGSCTTMIFLYGKFW